MYNKPTPYKISTITVTGNINKNDLYEINLGKLYELLHTIPNYDKDSGITYVEYGKDKNETIYKGFSKKFLINRRKNTQSKRFDNQMTIIYKIVESIKISNLNTKIFKNGKIQITGVKYLEQGKIIMQIIIDIIHKIYNDNNHDIVLVKDKVTNLINKDLIANIDDIVMEKYKIELINSDYKVGFNIKRDNLYNMILLGYKMGVSYEPCIYPGVKIKFFWNINNIDHINNIDNNDGICNCPISCSRIKGTGYGIMNCKTITVSIFQSGCIIITGAQSIEQIESAYKYINNILYKNIDLIENTSVELLRTNNNEFINNKKIMIKRENITKFTLDSF